MFYQRIYAFLLRRLLGPYLTTQSCAKLHSSIEVAVSEGRYVLRDVDLRGDKVTEILGLAGKGLTVQRATVRRLTVLLSLRDGVTSATNGGANGSANPAAARAAAYRRSESAPAAVSSAAGATVASTLSRTARLGTTGGGVNLIATLEIDGLEIDLGPAPTAVVVEPAGQQRSSASTNSGQNKANASQTGGGGGGGVGLLASYVDAALKSLRLSAELSDLRIRLLSGTTSKDDAKVDQLWVGIRLNSVKYHDLTALDGGRNDKGPASADSSTSSPPAVLRKEVEFNGLVFEVGGNKHAHTDKEEIAGNGNETATIISQRTVAKMEGSGDIRILAHAIRAPSTADAASVPTKQVANGFPARGQAHDNKESEITRLRHDIDFSLGDSRFDVCFDLDSLEYVTIVARALMYPKLESSADTADDPTATESMSNGALDESDYLDEASDVKALSDMMRQYAEARHLARTQQIRGGMLLPSVSFDGEEGEEGDGEVTFDTFFDANDQSFCAYRSLMEDSAVSSGDASKDDFVHTRVAFGFFETTAKLIWGSKSEYALLTVGEIKASSLQSAAETNVTLAVSRLEIEDSFDRRSQDGDGRTVADVGNILRFVEDSAPTELGGYGGSDDGCIISSSPCLSLNLLQKNGAKESSETSIDVSLHALEFAYRPSINKIAECVQSLSTKAELDDNSSLVPGVSNEATDKRRVSSRRGKRGTSSDTSSETPNAHALRCAVNLPTVTVFLPLQDRGANITNMVGGLFDRCGYTVSHLSGCESTALGLIFSDVVIDLSSDVVVPENNSDRDEGADNDSCDVKSVCLSCQNAIFFAAETLRHSSGGRIAGAGVRMVDIVALSSESAIDSDAIIKFQYSFREAKGIAEPSSPTKNAGQKGTFPLVPPLSAVKAQQQFEADEVDDIYRTGDASGKPDNLSTFKRKSLKSLTSSDPQYVMSSEASACDSNIEINVPTFVVDLHQREVSCLMRSLNELFPDGDECHDVQESQVSHPQEDITNASPDGLHTGIAFSCNQVSIALHGDSNENSHRKHHEASLAYVFIMDKIKLHVLKSSKESIRHVRFLLEDMTLYEARGLGGSLYLNEHTEQKGTTTFSVTNLPSTRCSRVRRRSARTSKTTEAKVICYRSKLSQPLSPETPAVMLDIINRSFADGDFEDEDDDDERELHLSVYDMTYRYDPAFDPSNLASIFSCGGGEMQEECKPREECGSRDELSSLTNLFVTFSDCVLDYTSPIEFLTASRSLIRISEVRASSTIVSPPGPFQAYKLSVGDVSVHLASDRFPYNAENALLSCSKSILNPQDMKMDTKSGSGIFFINSAIPIDATLRRMKFIQITTLDSVDALIVMANNNVPSNASKKPKRSSSSMKQSSQQRPNTTATFSLGQVCLYACQDSFVCLADTVNEWVLHYTTPPADEIEKLKASFSRLDTTKCVSAENDKGSLAADTSEEAVTNANSSLSHLHSKARPAASNGTTSEENKPPSEGSLLSMIETDMFTRENGSSVNKKDDLSSSFEELSAPRPSSIAAHSDSAENNPSDFEGTPSFTEDEDDWLAVDYEWSRNSNIPTGQEQAAKWFTAPTSNGTSKRTSSAGAIRAKKGSSVKILPQHVPIQSLSDPLSTGDMDAAKFAGTETPPQVETRIIVKDMSVNFRFFDGYDWPEIQRQKSKAKQHTGKTRAGGFNNASASASASSNTLSDKKAKLLSELLQGDEDNTMESSPQVPMHTILEPTQENGSSIQPPSLPRKIEARQTNRFFQLTGHKMKLRIDSFVESKEHRLASCTDMSLNDLFLAETISGEKPVKILGEWFNESEHPRDTNDGLLMLKMVSMHPINQFSADGKFMSDESRVTMELLPLRFFIYQHALKFIRDFFGGPTSEEETQEGVSSGDRSSPSEENSNNILVSPTFFNSFKLRPCKLKVDYRPERIDTAALRDGSYVELVNLLPLEEMVITLKPVEIRNLTGWGSVFGEVTRCWIEDICATQMHKFLTKSRPFQPFSSVGAGVAELVMIPLEEYKQDGNIIKGIRESTSSLAETVAYEALNTSAKVTRFAANRLSGASGTKPLADSSPATETRMMVSLPSRPDEVPSSFVDVAGHAFDSLTAGLREANYKIVYIPYKEYQRAGPSRAAKSIVKGIPVAVRAPLSGASEALSYTLLGVRNQIRPDMMKEEKVNIRGLSRDF